MHPPPHQCKANGFGRKITHNFGENFFFCFVLFWRPPDFGGKNVRISDFGRKITLNFGEDIRIFEGLCLKSPPPKFSRSTTGLHRENYGKTIGISWENSRWRQRQTEKQI